MHPSLSYLSSLTAMEWVNGLLALSAAAVAFSSINGMDQERVGRGLACAFVTLAAGFLGQALSGLLPFSWRPAFDTLLFGGGLALLLANRRVSFSVPKLSLVVTAGSWLIFFVAVS